ncbi:unnamed protein product, partial [Prorocentrum cordatum]
MNALRIALATLRAECKTFGPLADVCMFKVTTEAADHWRILCRHVYDLKKSDKLDDIHNAPVRALTDNIRLPSCSPTASEMAVGPAAVDGGTVGDRDDCEAELTVQEVKEMFDYAESGSSDCAITKVICQCDECKARLQRAKAKRNMDVDALPTDNPLPNPKMGEGNAKKKPACSPAGNDKSTLPVKIGRRNGGTKPKEAYILHSPDAGPFRYLAGQSFTMCDNYLENISELCKKIERGDITTKS